MIDLQLEPSETANKETSLPPLRCPVLRTSGRLKIVSIKKYLVQRLGLKDTQSSVSQHEIHFLNCGSLFFATSSYCIAFLIQIDILCNGDQVGNEHNLTFILRTRWFTPNKVLTLHYRLVE